jgi:phosphomannomutase
MTRCIALGELTAATSARFGTSGVRGLAAELSDRLCYAYTLAFLQHLEQLGELKGAACVAVGGDLRSSTGRILRAVTRAISDRGYEPVCCGRLPSPALALYGLRQGIATVMVTGSHIPDDRNGIKFTRRTGEILKADEKAISNQRVRLPDCFDSSGQLVADSRSVPSTNPEAARAYVRRYLDAFESDTLRGRRLGLYEHCAVGRDLLHEILVGLGAEVVRLGRSDSFVAIDTEAIRRQDIELARQWAARYGLSAIVSTDADSDRPLLSDESGKWLRGDVTGILCARFLEADVVVTPVSCNTAVERCGWFPQVRRTRIGSPFVIVEMERAVREGGRRVVAYEANGGFLTASDLQLPKGVLRALPTRDPVIVQLGVLSLAGRRGLSVSQLVGELPRRFTASDRLQGFAPEHSAAKLAELTEGGRVVMQQAWGALFGRVSNVDATDGLRITFDSGEVLHLRASGNAPELRCYAEADSEARAEQMVLRALQVLERWR